MTESTRAFDATPGSIIPHDISGYRSGCRCEQCRAANAAAARSYRRRKADGTVVPRRLADVTEWRSVVEEDDNGCLVWQAYRDRNGYARLGGKWAHRAVYEHEVGPIPERHELDHVCENPPCVNPDHLDAVTKAEHVARTMRRLGKDDKHQSAAYMRTMGLSYREIAETLGYQSKEGAHGAVLAAIRKGLVDPDDVPTAEPLSADDCQDIVELRAIGVPVNDIAEWYAIHPATASRLSRGARSGSEVA